MTGESGGGGSGGPGGGRGRGGRGRGGKGKGRGGGRGGRGGNNNNNNEDGKPNNKNKAKNNNNNNRSRRNKKSNAPAPAGPPPPSRMSQEEKQRLEEERKAAEAAALERKRLEEEQKAKEAARLRRQKEQQELETKVKEASDALKSILDATKIHSQNRKELSPDALANFRKSFVAQKKSLKSDLKKCTAFVKKIKSGGAAWNMKPDDITRDVSTLNLSRYVDEIVMALLEADLKLKDMPIILALSKAMHLRYPEFLTNLLPKMWSVVQGGNNNNNKASTAASSSSSTEETAKLRRVYVRILTEFVLHGIIGSSLSDIKNLVKLITECSGAKEGDKDDDNSSSYAVVPDVKIVVVFAKTAGFEILGVTPASMNQYTTLIQTEAGKQQQQQEHATQQIAASVTTATTNAGTEGDDDGATEKKEKEEQPASNDREEEESPLPLVISEKLAVESLQIVNDLQELLEERAVPDDVSEILLKHCKGAYKTLCSTLVTTHGKLQKMEKRYDQDRLLSGTLTEGREKGLADAQRVRESLVKGVEILSDILAMPMPHLKKDDDDNDEADGSGPGVELWTKEGGGENDFGPFDDEETYAFYCDIPDLLTTVPPALLNMTPEDIDKRKAENVAKYGSGFDNGMTDVEEGEGEEDGAEVTASSEAELEAAELEENTSKESDETKEETEENKDTPHYKLMVLLEQELPECCRREQIDEITERFCTNHGSTKNSRKRLSQTLFRVPRTRLDLLPYYSRMNATLSRVWPDFATSLVMDLEQQFHGQAKYKKNQNLESRMRTARYIGELTKFRVAPPMVAFRCLRRCLDDFTGGNVDVACCLLESCGRYLFRMKHTNPKLVTLMDTMMRLSKAKNHDERQQALINTAFYTVKPPPSAPKKAAKVYPPLEGYLRYLLMVKLQPSESSVAFVSKQLVRFPWADQSQQCGKLVCKIMLKACRRGRFRSINAVASVAAKLRRHKPEVCIRLLDAVLEELQWSMEHPLFKDQQRTLTIARLLGEMYSESLASGQLVLQQLYKFINFGHEIPDALKEASEKQMAQSEMESEPPGDKLPVFNSASAISQTIQEDEEVEDTELETREVVEEEAPKPIAVSRHGMYDPRVFSPLDPPNSAFRIKLVCTLLEVVSKSIVTRNNLPKVEGFLSAFQRYLFTKSILPAEVEFSLLDTFDLIDSQWRRVTNDSGGKSKQAENSTAKSNTFLRHKTWLDAHNAVVANEDADAAADHRAQMRLQALADTRSTDDYTVASSDMMNDDDDLMDDDDEDDSTEDALSHANDSLADDNDLDHHSGDETMDKEAEDEDYDSGGSEDDDEDSEEEDSEDDSDDEDESEEEFDEEAYMQQLEDEAFERELRRLTMDALEKGKAITRGGKVADSMPSGSQFIKKKQSDSSASAPPVALGGKQGISFQLLKKGNKGKMEAKQFYVPKDTNLAHVATKQDGEAARERDMIKARVLQYEADAAESSHSGGNVYLEQEKLQVIRNRPLSMEAIDRNFGTSGGNLRPDDGKGRVASVGSRAPSTGGRGPSAGRPGGRGGGRFSGRGGRGRGNHSGRTLV